MKSLRASSPESDVRSWIILALALLGLAVFAQVLTFDFVNYDDATYVYDNPHIQQGITWKGLRWAFQAALAFDSANADYWQPVTFLSRMVDIELWGLNPLGHHLTNLVLHLGNVLLVFLILAEATGSPGWSGFAAAVFAVHPLQVDPVSWVTARKDLLSTFFGLWAASCYLRAVRSRSSAPQVKTIALFALSLMAKPALLPLPFLLLLFDIWPLARLHPLTRSARPWLPVLLEKFPLALLAAGMALLVASSPSDTVASAFSHMNWAVTPISYLRYLWKALDPFRLGVLYPAEERWMPAQAVLATMTLAFLTFLATRRANQYPSLAVGWLWFLAALLPSIALHHENRFMYLPLLGLILMTHDLSQRLTARLGRMLPAAAALAIIAAYGGASWHTARRWRDTVALFENAVRATPRNALAYVGLAHSLEQRGEVEKARAYYEHALRLDPRHVPSHDKLGVMLARQGHLKEAMEHYAEALAVNPHAGPVHYHLGSALMRLGDFPGAADHCLRATVINPDLADAYSCVGVALLNQARPEQGRLYFAKTLAIDAGNLFARIQLAKVLLDAGEHAEALQHLEEVRRIAPGTPLLEALIAKATAVVGRRASVRSGATASAKTKAV